MPCDSMVSRWDMPHPDSRCEAGRLCGHCLRHAPAEAQADREVVLDAVRQDGRALPYASADLRAGREVVLVAVRQDGRAWTKASADLKVYPEIVLEAMPHDDGGRVSPDALITTDNLRADREVVLEAVRNRGFALEFASADLRADSESVLAALDQEWGHGDTMHPASQNFVFAFVG